jgi:cytoskeleton protein RodZ
MSNKNKIESIAKQTATLIKKKLEEAEQLRGSCGALLAVGRRNKGLSVQDVAARLCLSVSSIEALETDDYTSLPEATFIRGYIKSYAKIVKLDSDLVLSFFSVSGDGNSSFPKMIVGRSASLSKIGMGRSKLFIILISIAMIAYIIWYFQHEPSEELNPETTSDTQTKANQNISEGDVRSREVIPLAAQLLARTPNGGVNPVVDMDKIQVAASGGIAGTSLSSDREVTSPASIFTSPTKSSKDGVFKFDMNNLKVNCTSAVWLDIRDISGEKLFYRTCKPGEVIEFGIYLPAAVFVGNIDGAKLELDSKAVDLSFYSNSLSFARFTLNSWPDNEVRSSVSQTPRVQ